ncbi:MAG: radical SAM protein [Sulfuritalea sp.]|nr:radical SAM protein [Sulfuritalea sp.]
MIDLKKYLSNTWILKNPNIAFRVVKGFVRALVFDKPTLKTIEIFPTMNCNIECSMCSIEKYSKKKNGSDLTLDDYQSIAKQGADLGAFSVAILGGEPLMYKKLEDLIRIFKREHFFIDMVSNGKLATPERLAKMRSAGLDAVCFSLDSVDGAEHDKIRGSQGMSGAVHDAINAAIDVGLEPIIGTVFFPGKIEEGKAVQEYAKSRGFRLSGGQVAPVGGWEGKPTLSEKEHDEIRKLLRENPKFTLDWAMSYYFEHRCPAGKEKIAISNKGDVFGCSVNPISFGNVRDESIKDILSRMQQFSQFKKNSKVCLSAEDREYQSKYLSHLGAFDNYPVLYHQHPEMTVEKEPGLYRASANQGR